MLEPHCFAVKLAVVRERAAELGGDQVEHPQLLRLPIQQHLHPVFPRMVFACRHLGRGDCFRQSHLFAGRQVQHLELEHLGAAFATGLDVVDAKVHQHALRFFAGVADGDVYSLKTGIVPLAFRRSPAASRSLRKRSMLASPLASESSEVWTE